MSHIHCNWVSHIDIGLQKYLAQTGQYNKTAQCIIIDKGEPIFSNTTSSELNKWYNQLLSNHAMHRHAKAALYREFFSNLDFRENKFI